MAISSRTPEGFPNCCSICGCEFRLEPSLPTGDAPCPSCGHLLWWFREKFSDATAPLTADSRLLDDLHADSLDVVELVMEFEDRFRLTVPDSEYEKIRTVGDAIRLVRRLRGELQPGDFVEIVAGPFSGLNGTIVALGPQPGEARVAIFVDGRTSAVALNVSQLQRQAG